MIGRLFTEEEFRTGSAAGVAIISHSLWRERFGSAPIDGQTIQFSNRAWRIVGVFPPSFNFPYIGDVWIPALPGEIRAAAVFARLGSGVSLAMARERAHALTPELRQRFPGLGPAIELELEPARTSLMEQEDRTTTALLAVAGGFLLLACANVANLLVARTMARRRELAIRTALGAGGLRQYRSLVDESLMLG